MIDGTKFTLRAFKPGDEDALLEHLADKDIFYNTSRIPYPYERRDAEDWVRYGMQQKKGGGEHIFAIAVDDVVAGCISVLIYENRAEIGYWVGKAYWGQGLASEAVGLMVDYAFTELEVPGLRADVFTDNKRSIRVLEKNGFKHEETLERHINKAGTEKDVRVYRRARA